MVVGSIKRHYWRHFLALFKRKIAVLRFCAHHFTAGHTVNGLGQAVRCSHHTGAQPKPISQSGTPAMCWDKSVGWVKCDCLTDCNQTLWTLHHHHTLTHLNKTHFFLIPFCSSFIGIFQIIRSSCQIPEDIPYLVGFLPKDAPCNARDRGWEGFPLELAIQLMGFEFAEFVSVWEVARLVWLLAWWVGFFLPNPGSRRWESKLSWPLNKPVQL